MSAVHPDDAIRDAHDDLCQVWVHPSKPCNCPAGHLTPEPGSTAARLDALAPLLEEEAS